MEGLIAVIIKLHLRIELNWDDEIILPGCPIDTLDLERLDRDHSADNNRLLLMFSADRLKSEWNVSLYFR